MRELTHSASGSSPEQEDGRKKNFKGWWSTVGTAQEGEFAAI